MLSMPAAALNTAHASKRNATGISTVNDMSVIFVGKITDKASQRICLAPKKLQNSMIAAFSNQMENGRNGARGANVYPLNDLLREI